MIVHSQWQRVEGATSIVNALTVIVVQQTHGVCKTRRAPLLFGAEVENECIEEEKKDADWVNNRGVGQTDGGGVHRAKVLWPWWVIMSFLFEAKTMVVARNVC